MAARSNNRRGSPLGALLLGGIILSAAYYGPGLIGAQPDAADQFYLGILKFMGWLGVLTGLSVIHNRWLIGQQRLAAEVPSDTYGSAAFATPDECIAAGLTSPKGLFLGLLDGLALFFSGTAHLITLAPARTGKSVHAVIAALLHFYGSMIVTDPKGELAKVTGAHRAKRFGHIVRYFNPRGLHGLPQHRINPLENIIKLASDVRTLRGLSDEVRYLVLQLLPEADDEKNRFFRDGARAILFAVLLYLALCKPNRCTLPEMWRIIKNPRRLKRAIDEMCESDAIGGLLADLGDDLAAQLEDTPEQFGDFRSNAVQVLDIYEPGGYLAYSVSGSDVSLDKLKCEDTDIYLMLPQDLMATHGKVLGLINNQAIRATARSNDKGQVLFLLDEFTNLGKLSGFAESLTGLPGLGVRVWMFVQEFAELERVYGEHTAQTILSQAEVQQYFAVRSEKLAQRLSKRLGEHTVKTLSQNLGRFDDEQIGESLSETGRPQMSAYDILNMPKDEQLLLIDGVPPIKAKLLPFWFVAPWQDWAQSNPIEGDYASPLPLLELDYKLKEQNHE